MGPERPLLRLTPRIRGKRWQYYVLAPFVLTVVGPIVIAYKLFLGWWLNPVLEKRSQAELRQWVRADFAFLFQDFGGQFVPNERADKNEIVVTIEAEHLRVTVSRHHGDYGIVVARRDHPGVAESLASILELIYENGGSLRKPSFVNLAELGELFRSKFDDIQVALSKERYFDTVTAIDRKHQLGIQRAAQVFNRPDGFFEADVVNPNDVMKRDSK